MRLGNEFYPDESIVSIAEEAWRCGDPGMQFDTTIKRVAYLPQLWSY